MNKKSEDEEAAEEIELKTVERRLKMYSPQAIQCAKPIDKLVIKHSQFSCALDALDRVYQLGRSFDTPTGLRFIGPPGAGKTTVLKYFIQSLPRDSLFGSASSVLTVRMTRNPSLSRVLEAMLRAQDYPLPKVSSGVEDAKRRLTIDWMRRHETRLLVADEAHNLCARTTPWPKEAREGNAVTEYFREVMDSGVGLVLMGGKELDSLMLRDQYLHSRCGARFDLENFERGNEWSAVIKFFSQSGGACSIAPIYEKDAILNLHKATAGNLRSLKMILVEAILLAVDRGMKSVSVEDLKQGFELALRRDDSVVNPWR